jgi:hypothetical protein
MATLGVANYKVYDGSVIGVPNLYASDTTAKVVLGTTVKGYDSAASAYGEAEFRYVKFTGSAAIVAGDFCAFNGAAFTCIQASTATKAHAIGVAMAAQALNTTTPLYGWVMIRGIHDNANIANAVASADNVLGVGATLGRAVATAATVSIPGAINRLQAASGNLGIVELQWPLSLGV